MLNPKYECRNVLWLFLKTMSGQNGIQCMLVTGMCRHGYNYSSVIIQYSSENIMRIMPHAKANFKSISLGWKDLNGGVQVAAIGVNYLISSLCHVFRP